MAVNASCPPLTKNDPRDISAHGNSHESVSWYYVVGKKIEVIAESEGGQTTCVRLTQKMLLQMLSEVAPDLRIQIIEPKAKR